MRLQSSLRRIGIVAAAFLLLAALAWLSPAPLGASPASVPAPLGRSLDMLGGCEADFSAYCALGARGRMGCGPDEDLGIGSHADGRSVNHGRQVPIHPRDSLPSEI